MASYRELPDVADPDEGRLQSKRRYKVVRVNSRIGALEPLEELISLNNLGEERSEKSKVAMAGDTDSLKSKKSDDSSCSGSTREIDFALPIKRLKRPREIKLKLFLLFLFVVIVVSVILIWVFHTQSPLKFDVGGGTAFVLDSRELSAFYLGNPVLKGSLAVNIPQTSVPYDCSGEADDSQQLCLEWEDAARLVIMPVVPGSSPSDQSATVDCYSVQWTSISPYSDYEPALEDCYFLDEAQAHWYGGAEMHRQEFLLEKVSHNTSAYVSTDTFYGDPDAFGSVLDNYWLSSKGVALYVEPQSPLQVGINKTHLCLTASYKNYPYSNPDDLPPVLNYTYCLASNIRTIHDHMQAHFLVPNANHTAHAATAASIKNLWFVTAALFNGTAVDQDKVIQFAEQLANNSLSCGQVVLEDSFAKEHGDFDFDESKFPDPGAMVAHLTSLGCRLILKVHPFANYDTQRFQEGVRHSYWVQGQQEQVPHLVRWWNGLGALLDPTNPVAVRWYLDRLRQAQQRYGVAGFYFDAGETNWLPPGFTTLAPLANPGEYATHYAQMATQLASDQVPVIMDAGFRSQHLPFALHLTEREPTWDPDNGLKSLVPAALTLGLLGYPYLVPGCAPMDPDSGPPAWDLYVRWLQLSAFFPTMELCVPPWRYGPEGVRVARRWMEFHARQVRPLVADLLREAPGQPLMRPLWWSAPTDQEALLTHDQFFLGDHLLVAPVLEKQVDGRVVYLPEGRWLNHITDKEEQGGKFVYQNCSLEQIPYYTRIQ